MSDFSPDNYPVVPISDDAWQWFTEACEDMEIPIDDSKRDSLSRIYSHLLGVNEWLNLTRILSQKDYLKFHVFDSLTLYSLIDQYTEPGEMICDLGSGGGYPGIPLMLWLPDRAWRLVDSRAKKVEFLKEAVRLTPCKDVSARAFRGREAAHFAPDMFQKCSAMTARAVGKAVDLLPDASALLAHNGIFMVMKGQAYPTDERAELLHALPKAGFTLMEEHNIALDEADPDRWIILLMKTGSQSHKHK
ncbi:MAG: class I SAM-dependent methyltransferase [Victivallales bacterium]|nr:class I SAM-dependent methyltransferase [Victivallales bacterium]